jgi:hypothetical protein
MANLIITVISIALVAVAALSAAYYGGSAFMEGQTKAKATTVIEQGKQIAAAWTMYAINNGGEYTLTCDGNGAADIANNFVPKYLSSLPKLPDFASGGYSWDLKGLALDSPCNSTTEAYVIVQLGNFNDANNDAFCKAVNAAANIQDAYAFDQFNMPKSFGCVYISDYDQTYITYKVR